MLVRRPAPPGIRPFLEINGQYRFYIKLPFHLHLPCSSKILYPSAPLPEIDIKYNLYIPLACSASGWLKIPDLEIKLDLGPSASNTGASDWRGHSKAILLLLRRYSHHQAAPSFLRACAAGEFGNAPALPPPPPPLLVPVLPSVTSPAAAGASPDP